MEYILPAINPEKESIRITAFLKKTFAEQKINKAVIGLSGGIDSYTSYLLLKRALPEKNIFTYHLPFHQNITPNVIKNIRTIHIQTIVDMIDQTSNSQQHNPTSKAQFPSSNAQVRLGNIMARVRMMILFDQAKRHHALVCGTENKSEHYLGYFTRFGDQASDIEPIVHLYKTQVYQLAKYLGVPKEIIKAQPTAGLWKGQTDEKEFGFSYKEADQVLYLYFEKKKTIEEISKSGYSNAQKIIGFCKQNQFKHKTPYLI